MCECVCVVCLCFKYCVADETIEEVIQKALKRGKQEGIKGKEVTPFVLSQIGHFTKGLSLQTSILPLTALYLLPSINVYL